MFAIFGRKLFDSESAPRRQSGDDVSYIGGLYQRYKAFLFKKASLYTNNPHAKEDIVQSAVLRLMRNEDKLRTMDSAAVTAYLALTVRSAALNYLQSEYRDSLDALPLDERLEEDCLSINGNIQLTLEEQMLLGHRDNEIRAVIGRLSERDRMALMGKYFLGLDSQTLAELLGVTPGTLRTVLCRARGRALEELKREGILT